MKIYGFTLSLFLIFTGITFKQTIPIIPVEVDSTKCILNIVDTTKNIIPRPKGLYDIDLVKLKFELAMLESGGYLNPYTVVNQYGCMGKYQFKRTTLEQLVQLKYLKATPYQLRYFTKYPNVQESAMDALITHNKKVLYNYGAYQYIGTEVNGIKITLEGLLAGAHLVGPYAVTNYLRTGSLSPVVKNNKVIKKYDGNGTSVEKYIAHFST